MSHITSTDALIVTERIVAPIDAVFDFLVDPAKLSTWMGTADIDPRPGGHFQLDVGENRAVGEVHGGRTAPSSRLHVGLGRPRRGASGFDHGDHLPHSREH